MIDVGCLCELIDSYHPISSDPSATRQATELLFPDGGDPMELAKAPLANDVFAKVRVLNRRKGGDRPIN